MMALELIAEFDLFLATHIAEHGNPGRGKTSYLSSTTCDEFISLIALKIRNAIIKEVKDAKYFSIIVDSTPDVTHVDQLSFIIRYVPVKQSRAVERFLKFLPNVGHKSKDMFDALTVAFAAYDLNFQDCRGQSYDNAANMSGCYAGLQALLTELCPLAQHVGCAAHTLNLVGKSAVESILDVGIFFDYLEDFYNFLARSTSRWELLLEKLKPGQKVLKRVMGTRWSSRHNACHAFTEGWQEFMEILRDIESNESEKPENQRKAAGLRKNLSKFENVFMAVFWNRLLERFDKTNKILQAVAINLEDVVNHFKSLSDFVSELRSGEIFLEFIEEAEKLREEEYEDEQRRSRVPTLRAGETRNNETFLTGREKLKIEIYYAILDKLKVEFQSRSLHYETTLQRFSFLLNIQTISAEHLLQEAQNFQKLYAGDIEEIFPTECVHFKNFIQNAVDENEKLSASSLLAFILDHDLEELFANVSIAYKIFLCMAVTNCSAERAFSSLKRIKNYFRASMTETKLDDLALLCIESHFMESLNTDNIIDEFAHLKCRRKLL